MIVFTETENNYWYKDCRRGEVQHMNCNFQNMWFEFQKGTYDTKKNPKQLEASVIHLQLFGTSCTLRKNETKKAPKIRCFSVNTKMMKNSSFLVGHVTWPGFEHWKKKWRLKQPRCKITDIRNNQYESDSSFSVHKNFSLCHFAIQGWNLHVRPNNNAASV